MRDVPPAVPQHVLDTVTEEMLRQARAQGAYFGQSERMTTSEVTSAVERALLSGAEPPLEFAGMGMTGTVLCDARGHAFKPARNYRAWDGPNLTNYAVIEDEAAWLKTASETPGVREHVARFIAYHPDVATIERECVQRTDKPKGPWASGDGLGRLHDDITRLMLEQGWSAPEYKIDSYVETKDRGHVLVDAGFALRKHDRLVRYVEDILAGRRAWRDESPTDLAWALAMDYPEPRPAHVTALIAQLEALPPKK